jgi:hypothetical protein
MMPWSRNDALDLARDTIADLRRRLDDATADRQALLLRLDTLTDRLAALTERIGTTPAPVETAVDLSGVLLPGPIVDEITLAASNGMMARHLEQWAMSELRRGVEIATIVERIREGDEVLARGTGEDDE